MSTPPSSEINSMIGSSASFFDDDDSNIKFDFRKPDTHQIKDYLINTSSRISDSFYQKSSNRQDYQLGYYTLCGKYIMYHKSNTDKKYEAILDYYNARLTKISDQGSQFQHGFTLQKNGNTLEFCSNDEKIVNNWFQCLKQYCILTTFHDEYKAIKMIGKGSFAKVYLVENKKNNKTFAVKAFTKESIIVSSKSNAKPSMVNEIDIMRGINHENIIQLHDVYETEKSIYLVLELIQGKSLQDILKKSVLAEEHNDLRTMNIIKMILDALAYLASKNIIHRDLKPDNILLDKNDKIKIVDFGLATFIKNGDYIFKKCGTPGYIAPEVFKFDQKNPSTFYDDRCDVFSAGCIFYYMLFGVPFFDGNNASEILKMNRKITNEFESLSDIKHELDNSNSKINKDAIMLLSHLVEINHRKRITAKKALQMPYFKILSQKSLKESKVDVSCIKSPTNKSNSNLNSPKFSDAGLSNRKIQEKMLQDKLITVQNGNSNNGKDKYAEKDSLYLDMGAPILNGKIDTLVQSGGSGNNSILFSQGMNGSNPNLNSNSNSLSHFAKGANNEKKGKSLSKPNNTNPNSFLKAAIFRNMKLNNEGIEEFKESIASPLATSANLTRDMSFNQYPKNDDPTYRKFSEDSKMNNNTRGNGIKYRKCSHSPDSTEYVDDIISENSHIQSKLDLMKLNTLDKHPSKISAHFNH